MHSGAVLTEITDCYIVTLVVDKFKKQKKNKTPTTFGQDTEHSQHNKLHKSLNKYMNK